MWYIVYAHAKRVGLPRLACGGHGRRSTAHHLAIEPTPAPPGDPLSSLHAQLTCQSTTHHLYIAARSGCMHTKALVVHTKARGPSRRAPSHCRVACFVYTTYTPSCNRSQAHPSMHEAHTSSGAGPTRVRGRPAHPARFAVGAAAQRAGGCERDVNELGAGQQGQHDAASGPGGRAREVASTRFRWPPRRSLCWSLLAGRCWPGRAPRRRRGTWGRASA
jgi:hypothetical protein